MDGNQEREVTEVREARSVNNGTAVRSQSTSTVRSPGAGVVARRVVYYIGGVIIALLALRIILLLLAANQGSPFVDLIYGLSSVFAWPFYGIFSYQPTYGQSTFEVSSVLAIIIYALLTVGIGKLFTLTSNRTDV